jgi:uncharacterized protein with PQ loop repeat
MTTFLGFVYTFCFVTCYWPQIIKSVKTKSVEDVSLPLFLLSIVGYVCATIYTILKIGFDFWLLANYIFGCLSSIIMVIVYLKYKKNGSPKKKLENSGL